MNTEELKKLAVHARSMREMGVALVGASFILALFIFIPGSQTSNTVQGSLTSTDSASTTPNAFARVQIEASSAIVYDLATGETLYEKNADAQLPLASLTKLLTIYAALAVLSPDTPITIPAIATTVEDAHTFRTDQVFTLTDLARLTLTASLNDGSVAIAMATAERENRTQSEMLAGAAASLGLSQTFAVNGSGLDASDTVSGGYGSARDLAKLSGALVAMAPDIAEATTESFAEASSQGGTSFKVKNTDPIVESIPHLLLSKTGFTDLAGGNLTLVFDAGINHPIAVIVLDSSREARFTDATSLVSATLAHFSNVVL